MSLEQLRISGSLPSPKGVALAVMELCRSDDTTVEDLSEVVQRDPALSGRLLKLANSAAMGARPVAAVSEAVLRLGLRAVRNLATGFSLVDEYGDGACKGFDYQRFWSHSLLMALAMRELGVRTRAAVPDELFACGLMARIGRLALATPIRPNMPRFWLRSLRPTASCLIWSAAISVSTTMIAPVRS